MALSGGFGQYASKGSSVSFSNPVSDLVTILPRRPNAVFKDLLENGRPVDVKADRVLVALLWLKQNNPLYADISIDEEALHDITLLQAANESASTKPSLEHESNNGSPDPSRVARAASSEAALGSQGPLDGESLLLLSEASTVRLEDTCNMQNSQMLIGHMLRPFDHRRNHLRPSYDACHNIESYFPSLFPHGRGGPNSMKLPLGIWLKHALTIHGSRFASNLDFVFFVNSVQRRRRLTGLSAKAHLRHRCTKAIINVRELLSGDFPPPVIARRIDKLLRTGTLNASFENLPGSPPLSATLRSKSWAYLTHFGPCQLFLTLSVADMIDPYVFMQIDQSLTFEAARALPTRKRADLFSTNPVAATTIFHRRVRSLFDNFLFGETSPFFEIEAFLGRVEQQARHSPHLHLLIWLKNKSPCLSGSNVADALSIAHFVELFGTALLPQDDLTPQSQVPSPTHTSPIPVHVPSANRLVSPVQFSGDQRHSILSAPVSASAFEGSTESNIALRQQMLATQTHSCNNYCSRGGQEGRFMFSFKPQPRGSLAARSSRPSETRRVALAPRIALAPRTSPYINSSHPMLTCMFHSNTDVSVVTGDSEAESAYVCNYAVKADKNPLFDQSALTRLQRLGDGISDDRKLLAAIARNSTSVRAVGAQEAVDGLLGNPLTFLSADVKTVNPSFLLQHDGALTSGEMSLCNTQDALQETANIDLLPHLYKDFVAAVQSRAGKERNNQVFDETK